MKKVIASIETDADGRGDVRRRRGPAVFELEFAVGAYFGEAQFLDPGAGSLPDRRSGSQYHVPLLVSPWAYSTYSGS